MIMIHSSEIMIRIKEAGLKEQMNGEFTSDRRIYSREAVLLIMVQHDARVRAALMADLKQIVTSQIIND